MALSLFRVYDKPIGLHLDLGKCFNGCTYCYSGKRTGKVTSVTSLEHQLNREKESLLSYYIKNKYPVCVSNNSDINASDKENRELIKILKSFGFPIYYETKGCHTEEKLFNFLNIIKPEDYVYITLSTFKDEKRKEIEPKAPAVEMRIKLIEELVKKGIQIEVAFNPAIPGYIIDEEIIQFISDHRTLNYYFYFLHLPAWSKLNQRKIPKYDFTNIAKWCKENGIYVGGDTQFFGNKMAGFRERGHFKKPMIIASDIDEVVLKYKQENKGDRDDEENLKNLVSFDTFYAEKKDNFINAIIDKSEIYPGRNAGSYFYQNLPQKMSYKDYIKLCFHNANLGFIFAYSHCARIEYETGETKYFDYR